jgi:ectoine hydroxylase-related dioxygenase (phytanoyl-CoA dioxygenase family)
VTSTKVPTIVDHPWSDGFAWQRSTGPFRRLTAAQAAQFDDEGYVVLDGVFTADELAPVVADLDRYEARMDEFMRSQDGDRFMIGEAGAITFSPHAVVRSEAARQLAAHPAIVELCYDLVGPDVRLYWDQLVYKKPEKPRRFPWHQDNGYTFIEPQQYLTCWIALNDATVHNGCPQVVPGLHARGTLRHTYVEPLGWECFADHPDAVAAPVGAGGIAVFSSLTPHLTGPNTTDGVRKAYILQYAPEGAHTMVGDPDAGPPTTTTRCDAPDRQFPVLVGGQPVAPPNDG